ncbi:MAG: glycosyltransferase [Pontibacterium sp.]
MLETQVKHDHPYVQQIKLPFKLPTSLYGGMLVIWLLRPALQKRFPLHTNKLHVYLKFLAWCASVGRRQYALLRRIPAWDAELMQPIQLPELGKDAWGNTFTVGMYLIAICRAKYWAGQIHSNVKMRHRAARWYFRDGREMLGLSYSPKWQQKALQLNFKDPENFIAHLLLPKDRRQPGAESRIRENNRDIVLNWKQAQQGVPEILGRVSVPLAKKPSYLLGNFAPVDANGLAFIQHIMNRKPSIQQVGKVMAGVSVRTPEQRCDDLASLSASRKPWGVNLFGYARGELGIGEDVRMLARALAAASVPFCIVNVQPGADVSQADNSVEQWITDKPLYVVNLFCVTGIEMSRLVCEAGLEVIEGHYNIGLWPWELPVWPEAWAHAWNLVDELWGISHYTAKSYAKAPVPVIEMPLPVVLGKVAEKTRQNWKLPENAYLFVFSFDMNSTLSRKNPVATIRAFKKAFPDRTDDRVGLVLKVSHLDAAQRKWKEIYKLIKSDPRIYLISGELRRPDVLSLYQVCNCFVSLHRAEGFGRSLVEAQLLGLDLVTTGYSGNMNFCSENSTCLVDYEYVSLKKDEYFYGEGQVWADPDINHAAELMNMCFFQPDKDKKYKTNLFSLEFCGSKYRGRLELINSLISIEKNIIQGSVS